jgi:5'(3')-deoxyribonucleotidase
MRIFIDMDDILVNLLDEWLICLNNYRGVTPKTKEDITNWDMQLAYPTLTKNQLYSPLYDSEMWKRVQPVKDAYKYLKKLKEDGHEIYVATASYPNSYFIKTEYCLLKHFDFLTPKDIICINNKSLLKGDVLFDDYHENLRNFSGIKVLRNKPYNINVDTPYVDFRVDDWSEFYEIIQELNNLEEPY